MIDKFAFSLLCAFWLLFLGRTIMLMRQGVQVFVLAKGKTPLKKALELIMMPFLVIWSIEFVLVSWGIDIFPDSFLWKSTALRWVGVCLCSAGLLIFLLALISFGNAWRIGIDYKKDSRLVTTGVFAYSRNPIFLFMHMFFFGVFLIYPNWFFLLCSLGELVGVHMQILNEEKFLLKKFGDEYMDYSKKVRRYM